MSSMQDVNPLAELKKDKKAQKSLKNVLSSPYDQFWSPGKKEEVKKTQQYLEKNLPALGNLKSRISWKTLKKLSNENRKKLLTEKKEKIKTSESNKPLFVMRSFLSIGLNECSRSLNQDELSCLLVDGGLRSKRIAAFLVNLALAKPIPVLICPGLLEITLARFSFKALAIGIKTKINDSNVDGRKLVPLQNFVVRTFCKQLSEEPNLCDRMRQILHQVQEKIHPSNDAMVGSDNEIRDSGMDVHDEKRELKLRTSSIEETVDQSKSTEVEKSKSTEVEKSKSTEVDKSKSTEVDKSNSIEVDNLNITKVESEVKLTEVNPPKNIYRYRTNTSYRVFVPKSQSPEGSSLEFIAVGDPIKGHSPKKFFRKRESSEALFFIDRGDLKSPVVKKVKPNPKRTAVKRTKS